MPDYVEVFDITCPPNVTVANPTQIALFAGGAFEVRKLTVIIPDGHAGLTGIALGYGHTPILPRNQPAFISGNDESIPFDLTHYQPGVAWQAFVVNSDQQAHSWELRFEFDDATGEPATLVASPLAPAQIYAQQP